jgi:erythronate-4-phosphate dehydrogenase
LKKGLKEGNVKAASLDVWENEPNLDLDLLEMTDIATPHIAGYSIDGKVNGTTMIVKAISSYLNLRLENWYPKSIPEIDNKFELTCQNKSSEEILKEAILKTYNVLDDDISLRKLPNEFENLRGNYPIRREFHYFDLTLKGGNKNIHNLLSLLGFQNVVLK